MGYTHTDDDRDRWLAVRIWLQRNDADFARLLDECDGHYNLHDIVELRGLPRRDFLSEQVGYDIVITHDLWGRPGYSADDALTGAACSPQHSAVTWRRRFQDSRARYIFMFGSDFNAANIGGFLPRYQCLVVPYQSFLTVFVLAPKTEKDGWERPIDYWDMNHARLEELSEFLMNRALDLSYTKVNSEHLSRLSAMIYLEELRLVGTAISDAHLEHIAQRTRLKTLNLDGTRISNVGLCHLRNLRHLECLSLNHTGVDDDGLFQLRELPDLKWLSLVDTGVSDRGTIHLLGMEGLEWLSLVTSKVTPCGVEELKRALPQCAVRSDFD